MPFVWENMTVPVQREAICIIDCFVEETPPIKSPWAEDFLYTISFSLDQMPKIKICHMAAKEHPEVIVGGRFLLQWIHICCLVVRIFSLLLCTLVLPPHSSYEILHLVSHWCVHIHHHHHHRS